MKRHSFSLFSIRVAAAGALALSATACEPLVITVTTTDDGVAGSLRAAIDAANASDASEIRIELAPGTYRLTLCAGSEDDDNQAGDLDLRVDRPITLAATGPDVIIQQACTERVLHSLGTGLVKLSGITLTGGNSRSSGGGLNVAGNAELTRCQVVSNSAFRTGGGIAVGGALTLSASQVLGNSVFGELRQVGGAWIPGPASGAGVHARSVTARDATIARNYLGSCSSFLGNGPSEGGGIWAEQSASLTNVTIADHVSPTACSAPGNAGMAVRARSLQLEHVTIAGNLGGAALYVETLLAGHSVVVAAAGHTACGAAPNSGDSAYNWFSDASCALTGAGNEQQAADFALGALADNGGPVVTRKPGAGSVLIDRITTCSLSADARGVARPQGPACDIGAVEVE